MVDLFGNPEPVELPVVEEIIAPPIHHGNNDGDNNRHVANLIGHGNELHQLRKQWRDNNFPHGLLIHGRYGIGKSLMAMHLAGMILSKEGIDMPALLQRIASGGHPDFLKIGREWDDRKGKLKAEVSVDSIRTVPNFLRKTAAEGGWRVVVIDDADCMNRNAQNALLKSLEEPPKNAVLILVCHQIGSLIPTIRSRTQDVMLGPLTAENITAILREESVDPMLPLSIALSCGSAGQSQEWLASGVLNDAVEVIGVLDQLSHVPEAQSLPIIQKLSVAEDGFALWHLIVQIIDMALLSKANGATQFLSHEIPPHAADSLTCWLNGKNLEQLLEIRDKLDQHVRHCEIAHLDKYTLTDKGIRILRQVI